MDRAQVVAERKEANVSSEESLKRIEDAMGHRTMIDTDAERTEHEKMRKVEVKVKFR